MGKLAGGSSTGAKIFVDGEKTQNIKELELHVENNHMLRPFFRHDTRNISALAAMLFVYKNLVGWHEYNTTLNKKNIYLLEEDELGIYLRKIEIPDVVTTYPTVVYYQNKIHFFGYLSNNDKSHCTLDIETSIVEIKPDTPYRAGRPFAIVNNKLYANWGDLVVYDGTSWTTLSYPGGYRNYYIDKEDCLHFLSGTTHDGEYVLKNGISTKLDIDLSFGYNNTTTAEYPIFYDKDKSANLYKEGELYPIGISNYYAYESLLREIRSFNGGLFYISDYKVYSNKHKYAENISLTSGISNNVLSGTNSIYLEGGFWHYTERDGIYLVNFNPEERVLDRVKSIDYYQHYTGSLAGAWLQGRPLTFYKGHFVMIGLATSPSEDRNSLRYISIQLGFRKYRQGVIKNFDSTFNKSVIAFHFRGDLCVYYHDNKRYIQRTSNLRTWQEVETNWGVANSVKEHDGFLYTAPLNNKILKLTISDDFSTAEKLYIPATRGDGIIRGACFIENTKDLLVLYSTYENGFINYYLAKIENDTLIDLERLPMPQNNTFQLAVIKNGTLYALFRSNAAFVYELNNYQLTTIKEK